MIAVFGITNKIQNLLIGEPKEFDEFLRFFKTVLPVPRVAKEWETDREFGKTGFTFTFKALERIWGASCDKIKMITSLKDIPENLILTDKVTKIFLGDCSFEKAIEDKRIYILDNSFLINKGELKKGVYLTTPYCIFYLNDKKELMPGCIQLYADRKTDEKTNPIFTCEDPTYGKFHKFFHERKIGCLQKCAFPMPMRLFINSNLTYC